MNPTVREHGRKGLSVGSRRPLNGLEQSVIGIYEPLEPMPKVTEGGRITVASLRVGPLPSHLLAQPMNICDLPGITNRAPIMPWDTARREAVILEVDKYMSWLTRPYAMSRVKRP
jgi:hypothetical protein